MKRSVRTVALLLALIMLLSLSACSDKEPTDRSNYSDYDLIPVGNETGAGDNYLSPETLIASLDFTPKLLSGWFEYEGTLEEPYPTCSFLSRSVYNRNSDTVQTMSLSAVPVEIAAGASALSANDEDIRYDKNHSWAVLTYLTQGGETVDLLCSVSIIGSIVSYTPVNYYQKELNSSGEIIAIAFEVGDTSFDYNFVRGSNYLTLKSIESGESITLNSRNDSEDYVVSLGGYMSGGSPDLGGMQYFSIKRDLSEKSYGRVKIGFDRAAYAESDCCASYSRSGLLNLSYGTTVQSFVYLNTYESCILVDAEGTAYYFTESKYTAAEALTGFPLHDIDGETHQQMNKMSKMIIDTLIEKMHEGGIEITYNYETGEVSLDSGILFDVNSYEISDSGKETLNKFIEIYTSVIYGETFNGCVSSIVVEGHTDTNGGYDANKTLSEKRADTVLQYCLGCPSAEGYTDWMADMMSSVGMSYDRPVLNEDGSVNLDASRRVSFRINITVPET